MEKVKELPLVLLSLLRRQERWESEHWRGSSTNSCVCLCATIGTCVSLDSICQILQFDLLALWLLAYSLEHFKNGLGVDI